MISKDSRNTQFTNDSIPTLDQDAGKDVPLYVQIYDILYELIQSGAIPPGNILPGENALVAHFGISRGTVRQAMRYLEEDGLIITRQGCGSVVADLRGFQAGLQRFSDVCQEYCTVQITDIDIRIDYTGAGSWLSSQMQTARGALMLSAEITYRSGDEVIALSTRLIPAELLSKFSVDAGDESNIKDFATNGISQLIARTHAVILIKTDNIPESLEPYGVPILSVMEIAYDIHSNPVGYIKSYLRNDCFQLCVTRMRRIR